jgi:hypothetical protein
MPEDHFLVGGCLVGLERLCIGICDVVVGGGFEGLEQGLFFLFGDHVEEDVKEF